MFAFECPFLMEPKIYNSLVIWIIMDYSKMVDIFLHLDHAFSILLAGCFSSVNLWYLSPFPCGDIWKVVMLMIEAWEFIYCLDCCLSQGSQLLLSPLTRVWYAIFHPYLIINSMSGIYRICWWWYCLDCLRCFLWKHKGICGGFEGGR